MLRFYFAMAIATACLYSCSPGNDEGNITLLKEVNNSLLQSNHVTKLSTNNTFESLKDKTKDPTTSERAAKWFSKAITVKKLTDSIIGHIERIKSGLIEEAGFDPLTDVKTNSARAVVANVFKVHKEGQLLYEKLALYKKDMLAVDSMIRQYMANSISIPGTDMINREESFADKYFNTTVLGAITMLNKIENDIRFTENKLTEFCNDNVTGCNLGLVFNSYYPIISQNAKIVMPGDDMQIIAGIGEFSMESKPVVTIADQKIPLTAMGYSQYDFKASSKPGTHRIPVRIKYFDQIAGKEVEVEYTIEYTVKPD